MPGEVTLFSAIQKKLLETQEELDQACGKRHAEARASLYALITEDLLRYQLYTQTVATLALDISAQQARLLQKVRKGESKPVSLPAGKQEPKSQTFKNPIVKPGQAGPDKSSNKNRFWASLALLGSAFSRVPATTAAQAVLPAPLTVYKGPK